MEFKDRLKELIDNKLINGKKVTPYSIGKNTMVSRQSIENYLAGKQKPSIDNATIIADYFNVSADWLLYGDRKTKSRIYNIRVELNKSVEEFSSEIGVCQNEYLKMEDNKIPLPECVIAFVEKKYYASRYYIETGDGPLFSKPSKFGFAARRLQILIDTLNLDVKTFAHSIGYGEQYVLDQVCSDFCLSADFIAEISSKYADVSLNWLIKGEGDMFTYSTHNTSEIVSEDNLNLDISMDSKDVVIKALTEKIQRLENENAELRRKYETSEERPGA